MPGDTATLHEFCPHQGADGAYTGETLEVVIDFVLRDAPHYGLPEGFAVMGTRTRPDDKVEVASGAAPEGATVRADLALLVHQWMLREIGRLMQQAEHWANNGAPAAVHHRLRTADAYYQVAVQFDASRMKLGFPEPFADLEAKLAAPPIKPAGAYPYSRALHAYNDVRFVVAELDRLGGSKAVTP